MPPHPKRNCKGPIPVAFHFIKCCDVWRPVQISRVGHWETVFQGRLSSRSETPPPFFLCFFANDYRVADIFSIPHCEDHPRTDGYVVNNHGDRKSPKELLKGFPQTFRGFSRLFWGSDWSWDLLDDTAQLFSKLCVLSLVNKKRHRWGKVSHQHEYCRIIPKMENEFFQEISLGYWKKQGLWKRYFLSKIAFFSPNFWGFSTKHTNRTQNSWQAQNCWFRKRLYKKTAWFLSASKNSNLGGFRRFARTFSFFSQASWRFFLGCRRRLYLKNETKHLPFFEKKKETPGICRGEVDSP